MEQEQWWFTSQPDSENFGLSLASDTEAYVGHLSKARQLTNRSVESAMRADSKETAAIWRENAALREAAFGNNRAAVSSGIVIPSISAAQAKQVGEASPASSAFSRTVEINDGRKLYLECHGTGSSDNCP